MEKLNKIQLVLLSLLFLSCNSKDKDVTIQSLREEVKELKIEVNNLKKETQNLKAGNTTLEIMELGDLKLFNPKNFKISIYSKRPQKNNKTFLVVPAAFTDPNNTIDGKFVENGKMISNDINNDLNGACIISNGKFMLIPSINLTSEIIKNVGKNRNSLFQQFLLIKDYQIIRTAKFENTPSLITPLLRRAIIELNCLFYLVESKKRMTLLDFQNSLISNNVKNAIYLDMGTYSEGWYKKDDKTITIGETMTQTNRQSNWLVFESL